MKMMKFVLPALALTAWANVASATLSSPIYEIRECDANGDALSGPVATKDNPLQGGDTIYFVIRMLNPDFDTVADSATTPWAIKYKNGATGIEDLDWLVSAPGVGIVVNNTTRKAEFVKIAQHPVYTFYTDMVFKYQIKPGDIALPIRLASDLNGTPVASGSAGIYWFRDDLWEIGKSGTAVGTAKVGELKYAADEYLDAATVTGRPDSTLPSRRNNWDAYECGFYANTVKAVTQGGFAAKTTVYDGNVCMTVINKNSSTCTPIPTISLVGTPSDTSYLYVWSADDNIAEIVEGNDVIKVNTVAEMWNADGTGKLYNVKVGTIKLVAGQSDYKFTLTCKGKTVTPGQSVKIYLSESPNGFFKRGSGVVADYLEETVYIGEALQPNITITGPDSITVGADYKSALDTLTITTSEIYPLGKGEGLRVTVTPSFSDTSITENIYDYVRIADNNEGTSWNTDGPCDFVLTPGTDANLTKTLYLFGRGADKNTYGTKNISFTVTVEDADHPGSTTVFDNYYKLPAPLPITFVPASTGTGTLPQITTASALTVTANTDTKFSLKVTDNKKNIESPTGYTIQYKKKASDTWKTMDGKWKPNSSGILVSAADPSKFPTLKYAYTGSDYVTSFKLIAPDDLTEGSEVQITVSIEEPKSMFVRIIEEDGTESDTGTFVESDDDEVTIQVQLSEAYADATVYAFLVPDDDDTKAAVKGDPISTSTYNRGLEIKAGQKTSKLGYIQFVDGSRTGTHCQFKIELRNGPTYATSALVAGYESETFTVLVRNKTPSFNAVWMSGARVFESGGTMSGIVPQGANKTFTFDVSDVEADLTADGSDTAHREFEIHCVIEENDSPRLDCTLTGDPNNLSTNYTFMVEGTAKARFQLRDKDMNKYGSEFVCYIKVGSQPQVSVVSADGLDFFNEKSTGINNSKMNIVLSEAAAKAIKVKLTVTPASGTLPDGLSLPKLGGGYDTTTSDPDNGVYEFEILPNQPTKTFYFTELDGTSFTASTGWKIHAEVSSNTMPTDAATPDPDKTWAQYYIATDYYFTVDNVEPTFMCSLGEENTVSNAYAATIGTGGAITYSVNDIKADLENGIKVTWWCSDTGSADTTNITGTANCTYTPEFKSAGTKVVKVTVQDKDAASGIGTIIKQWYFTVATSKTLTTLAHGPSGGTSTSSLSQRYETATGRGEGHVWADGSFAAANDFRLVWNMGTRTIANFYGYGYKPGIVGAAVEDNGSLDGNGTLYLRDIPLDANGNNNTDGKSALGSYYSSALTDGDGNYLDSYLYTWLVTTASESGGMSSEICGSVSPERGGGKPAVGQIALPSQKTDDGNYADTILEAIFSKEWRTTDNCGDINQDGIPDAAVLQYGFGVYANRTLDTTKDLDDLSGYNEDEDYLPSDKNYDSNFLPGLSNSWAKTVNAFTAIREIRGYGLGLNNGTTKMDGVTANVGLADITCGQDLEPVEIAAWNSVGGPAGNPSWSPERPTDPTKTDTDGDGLPDGYEYYYWYKSHVGYLDDKGVHHRLQGHKLEIAHPEYVGDLITWETIAENFDPLIPGEQLATARDLDNDGLSDYEEYVLGTSPIEWDSDRDGLSDFWEVHFAPGLSPLKYSTNNVQADGMRNPDFDYMAQIATNLMYVTTMIDPGTGREVYYATQADDSYGQAFIAGNTCISFRIGATTYAYIGDKAATAAALITGVDTDNDPTTGDAAGYDEFFFAIDVPLSACYELSGPAGTVGGAAEFSKGTKVDDAGTDGDTYGYLVYSGSASADGAFGSDRSYSVWQYGRPGVYPYSTVVTYPYTGEDKSRCMAMGREADIPTTYPVIQHDIVAETVLLNHWQVYQWRGFELDPLADMGTGFSPTTAWRQNDAGYVGMRWQDAAENGGSHLDRIAGKFGDYSSAGRAMDTSAFVAIDEFLVDAFFRNATGVTPDLPHLNGQPISYSGYYSNYTTLPQNLTNSDGEVTAYGADSDGDGVPDGWELYVQCGPGEVDTRTFKYKGTFSYSSTEVLFGANASMGPLGPRFHPRDWDYTKVMSINPITGAVYDDDLNERQEFWGTDSTAAYSSVPTIADVTPVNARWLNKFWPTDPWSSDTDCDGLSDSAEQRFIYGQPQNTAKWWIAGGGLNPCTWDTDRDGLPDLWEAQYAGIVYPREDEDGEEESGGALARRLIYALADFGFASTNAEDVAKGCYGGLDGTVPDSFTGIEGGYGHNCDYDYDGLQNWQEYLTGTIRAFRYDDVTSPWTAYPRADKQAELDAVDADIVAPPTAITPLPPDPSAMVPPAVPTVADWLAYGQAVEHNKIVTDNNAGAGLTYPVQTAPMRPIKEDYATDSDYYMAQGAYNARILLYDAWLVARAAVFLDWTYGVGAPVGSYPLNPLYRKKDVGTTYGAGINPNTVVDTFDWVAAYGSICRRPWDTACGAVYFFPDGPNHALRRNVMLRDEDWEDATDALREILRPINAYERRILDVENSNAALEGVSELVVQQGGPQYYFGTSPITEDSDLDGLDDYYELFHGLNPLYGGDGGEDLISLAWRSSPGTYVRNTTGIAARDDISAKNNLWIYEGLNTLKPGDSDYYDFVKFPWMNGAMEADPDGDDIRNQYESIKPNIQANDTYLHTDPTPLWMTDSSYSGSIVSMCYRPIDSLWTMLDMVDANHWGVIPGCWNWTFEENEGFDTDTDWYSDFREGQKGSDPQDSDSPYRRQAMYFPGGTTFGAVQVQEDMMISVLNNIKDNVQQFATFTVECWAKAENPASNKKQVLVERMIQNGASNLGDQWFLRRNFQLGIDKNGYWYAAFDHDGTGDVLKEEVVATSPSPAGTEWTHLAAVYDGKSLDLYVNGQMLCSKSTTLKPATGVLSVITDIAYNNESYPIDRMRTIGEAVRSYAQDRAPRRSIIMGAGVAAAADTTDMSSMTLDENTGVSGYAHYYSGYLDEVRLWDGARSDSEIKGSYMVRMTKDDIAANRNDVFEGLQDGKTRDLNQSGVSGELPAELLYHFSFDNIASAEADTSIAHAPFGMQAATADARYVRSVPANWQPTAPAPSGWISPAWNEIGSQAANSAKSTVYGWDKATNTPIPYSMVPWIKNTVAHLPSYDGTVRDSVYWKADFGARSSAASLGYTSLMFPRSADPYNHVQYADTYTTLTYAHQADVTPYMYYQIDRSTGSHYYELYKFQRRNEMLLNTDALPLGGAFAKYCSDMWDGQGATTTSEVTGEDADNNGVADWMDDVLFGVGNPHTNLGDTFNYGGLTDTVAHHVARLLAKGANKTDAAADPTKPAGTGDYKQTADFNSSGLPDWWEDLYSLSGNGLADDDNDGLSNYTEYLLSEVFNTGTVFNPTLARSIDEHKLDYFAPIGKLYAGEIFTDHDRVEDAWEDDYDDKFATRLQYDANLDSDGDGWSMRSEARYSQMVKSLSADGREHYNVLGDRIVDLPVPTLELTVNYVGQNQNDLADKGLIVYVKHESSQTDFDAKYIVAGGSTNETSSASSTSNAYTQVIGKWSNRHVVGTLTPGNISSLSLEDAYTPDDDTYTWRLTGQDAEGETVYVYKSGTKAEYRKDRSMYGTAAEIISFDGKYHSISSLTLRYSSDNTMATVYLNEACTIEVGTVNLKTGEYDFDLGAMAGVKLIRTGGDENEKIRCEDCTWRIVYDAHPSYGMPRTVYLGEATVGTIKEGKNNLIVVADLDGDGVYTPGEPMGCVPGVDVGWRRGQASVALSETSPISIRMDLLTGENDRTEAWGGWADVTAESDDKAVNEASFGKYVRMRVVRAYVNGTSLTKEAMSVPVVNRIVDLESEIGRFLTEADLIFAGQPDLDWENGAGLQTVDATNVQYRVVFGNGDILGNSELTNTAKYMFDRRYDANSKRAKAVPLSPTKGNGWEVKSVRPTFRWRLDPVERDTYTAFRVVIKNANSTFIYDSGVLPVPPRSVDGEYEWTAPICVTDEMAGKKFTGDTSKGVFANGAEYTYTIQMYNSKFQNDLSGATAEKFALVVPESSNPAYGSVAAKVRYFGPNTTAKIGTGAMAGKTVKVYDGQKIHLQAFTSPDFTGIPASSTVVDVSGGNIDADNPSATNAKLIGLDAGTYYLRAFIDSNDNGTCEDWESMGYLCGQGTAKVASIYNPVGIRFTVDMLGKTQDVEIYIEDADTNQNAIPDVWEYTKHPDDWQTRGPSQVSTDTQKLGITFAYDVDTTKLPVPAKTSPGAVSGGLAGRVLLAMSNPTVAALSMGYDTLEAAEAAADSLDEEASVVAITSLELDGTTAKVGYTTDVNTMMSAAAAKSPFYVASGNMLSFRLVVKTKANLADKWAVADTDIVTVTLGAESTGEVEVELGEATAGSGFVSIELKQN